MNVKSFKHFSKKEVIFIPVVIFLILTFFSLFIASQAKNDREQLQVFLYNKQIDEINTLVKSNLNDENISPPIPIKNVIEDTLKEVPFVEHFYIRIFNSAIDFEQNRFEINPSRPRVAVIYSRQLELLGKLWTLEFSPLTEFMPEKNSQNLLSLIFSLLVLTSFSISLIFYFLLNTRQKAFEIAHELTRDLNQKKSQVTLLAALSSENNQPIMRMKKNGEILYFNKASESILNYWRTKEGLLAFKELLKIIQKKSSSNTQAFDVCIKDQTFSILLIPIYAKNYVNLYGRDVTKEREVEKMKSEFVSIASHQLKTPITGLKWHSEILLTANRSMTPTEKRRSFKMIHESAKRLDKLIDHLLDVSRIEAGRNLLMEKNPVNMHDFLQDALSEARSMQNKSGVTAILTCHHKREETLMMDKQKLKGATINLLDNAFKYSSNKGKVKIDCEKNQSGKFIVSITSHGLIISKEDQKKIFQKFFRSQEAVLIQPDGTGVGLFISKAIIEAHGGKLWFESSKEKGTVFYFTI